MVETGQSPAVKQAKPASPEKKTTIVKFEATIGYAKYAFSFFEHFFGELAQFDNMKKYPESLIGNADELGEDKRFCSAMAIALYLGLGHFMLAGMFSTNEHAVLYTLIRITLSVLVSYTTYFALVQNKDETVALYGGLIPVGVLLAWFLISAALAGDEGGALIVVAILYVSKATMSGLMLCHGVKLYQDLIPKEEPQQQESQEPLKQGIPIAPAMPVVNAVTVFPGTHTMM